MGQAPAKCNPKPGDLIEIFCGTYQHWAIYVGGDEVVHLTNPNDASSSSDVLFITGSSSGSTHALVRRDNLQKVVGENRYQVNNLWDGKRQPRDSAEIVKDACSMVGQLVPYSVTTSNCEHFVTKLRYGEAKCQQVDVAAGIGGGITLLGVLSAVAVTAISILQPARR